MNSKPDPSLDIFWGLKFKDGSFALDKTSELGGAAEWFSLQNEVSADNNPVLMKLFKKDPAQTNKYTSVELPSNGAKHFFFSKKALVRLGDKESIESTGMGFYDEELGQVIIHWYDSNLELMEIDNRNPEKCAHLMIPKITQAFLSPSSKSQSKRSSQS